MIVYTFWLLFSSHNTRFIDNNKTVYKGLATILTRLICSDCNRKLDNLEGQVDSKLRQQINEKKVAQGLKISYTPVEDDEEDEDEDIGLIL